MIWIILAVVAALFNTTKNLLTKKVTGSLDAYTVAFASNLVMLPVLWTAAVLAGNFTIQPMFWTLMVLMLPFELLVTVLFFKAMQDSELSSAFPFVAFLPFFVAVGSYFILGELPGVRLFVGLVLLSVGAFMLNRVNMKASHFVWRGALYMFMVSMLWGYIIPMGKLAVTYSSARLYPAIYFTLATLLFVPIYFLKRKQKARDAVVHWKVFVGIGLSYGLFVVVNWAAYARGPASGVSALALLSVFFTVLFGGTYFKEHDLRPKLIATALMLGGAFSIIVGALL